MKAIMYVLFAVALATTAYFVGVAQPRINAAVNKGEIALWMPVSTLDRHISEPYLTQQRTVSGVLCTDRLYVLRKQRATLAFDRVVGLRNVNDSEIPVAAPEPTISRAGQYYVAPVGNGSYRVQPAEPHAVYTPSVGANGGTSVRYIQRAGKPTPSVYDQQRGWKSSSPLDQRP